MKKYHIYRDIRKNAIIMGLPLSYFAMLMVSVIGSLLIIIFSFSPLLILLVVVFNVLLFGVLARIAKHAPVFRMLSVFPKTISNKRISPLVYEN